MRMRGLKPVANRRTDALAQTHWAEVEHMLAEYYRRAGYEVDHCGTGATSAKFDGGVDLKLRRADERIVLQCKHWNAMKVAHNDVHQLLGIMVNEGATGAILVTSGEFTKAAIEAATKQGHVQLVDGDDLREMLGPLPEPESSKWSALMSSDMGQGAARVGRYAGERLLDAAEDRIRGRSRRSPDSGLVGATIKVVLIKAGLGLFMMIGALLVAGMIYNRAIKTLQTPRPAQASQEVLQSQPLPQSDVASGAVVVESTSSSSRAAGGMTQEEIREWQRKSDESMKILEATTPELYNGEGERGATE